MWSHWGRDWEARATPESIARRVSEGAGEGAVLLLHDADDYSAAGSWRRTAAALPRVLDALAARGLEATVPSMDFAGVPRKGFPGNLGPRARATGGCGLFAGVLTSIA